MIQLAQDYLRQGIAFVAINSNDITQVPADSPAKMKEVAVSKQYPFPYLFDESQEVARAYQAACTPDFFVFDGRMHLVYRGQLDDSRPDNGLPVTGESIRSALDQLLTDKPITTAQKPSLGCSIKWKV